MGVILQFKPKAESKPKMTDAHRLKMLAKGKVDKYNCNGCGYEIEVIDNDFPDRCPGCGDELDWSEFE